MARKFMVILGGLLLQSAFFLFGAKADPAVSAELVIPPAETYVIGDRIPLYWRFTNKSGDPLAFMWESCCRLNGRLQITRSGQEVKPLPPGQALAHMFAKAEVLPPGRSQDFDTFLSDWVLLPESGTYDLHGRYVGVLPTQKPMVPRGVSLWRDAAETGSKQLSVLSVRDYLAQRDGRSQKRGVRLELSGPQKLPLVGAGEWTLRLQNVSDTAQTLQWPNDFSIWMVNREGFREVRVPSGVESDYAALTLPPGQTVERKVSFDYTRMEGEPLGRYQLFVDLQTATNGAPRVPSNPLPFAWEFGQEEVTQLVAKAASGSHAGLRNPALKFLRVYLAEFGPALKAVKVPADNSRANDLLAQLRVAADLKVLMPEPGRKDWELTVNAAGNWQFAGERARQALGAVSAAQQVQHLLAVRRHLGMEAGLWLNPEPDAPLSTWLGVAKELIPFKSDLVVPLYLKGLPASTNATGMVRLTTEPVSPNAVLRFKRAGKGWGLELARKFPDPQTPQLAASFGPEELKTLTYEMATAPQLAGLLADKRFRSVQLLVLCPPDVTWPELRPALEPVWSKVSQVDLAATQ